eukprot:gene2965-5819_t
MSESGKKAKKAPNTDTTAKDITEKNEAFLKRWSAPLLLGPFIPAIFSIIVIVGGNVVLNSGIGVCGYALSGDHFQVYIPIYNRSFTVLKPITSLTFLAFLYSVLGLASFICWSIGSFYMTNSIFCAETAPALYSFCLFIVVVYWIGFFIVIFYVIKINFGQAITVALIEQTRAPNEDELEEGIFRKVFLEIDRKKLNRIPREDLPKLLSNLGVYIPDEDLPDLENMLDPSESGDIEFYPVFKWFKAYRNAAKNIDDGDEKDDDDEAGTTNKKKGKEA